MSCPHSLHLSTWDHSNEVKSGLTFTVCW